MYYSNSILHHLSIDAPILHDSRIFAASLCLHSRRLASLRSCQATMPIAAPSFPSCSSQRTAFGPNIAMSAPSSSSSSSLAEAPPPSLKALTPYMQRYNELAKADVVMSYWCLYYAAQQGIAAPSKDAKANGFLLEIMDRLEEVSCFDVASLVAAFDFNIQPPCPDDCHDDASLYPRSSNNNWQPMTQQHQTKQVQHTSRTLGCGSSKEQMTRIEEDKQIGVRRGSSWLLVSSWIYSPSLET